MKKMIVILFVAGLLFSCKASKKNCGCPYGLVGANISTMEHLAQR